jgi:hypothetical protein
MGVKTSLRVPVRLTTSVIVAVLVLASGFNSQVIGEEEGLVLLEGGAEVAAGTIAGDVAGVLVEAAFGMWFAAFVGVLLLLNLSGVLDPGEQR